MPRLASGRTAPSGLALVLVLTLVGAAGAQEPVRDAVPDLKGVWTGTARAVVYGAGHHHPGKETDRDPARISEVPFTYTVEGQDGRLAWGTTRSPSFEEPFAWAISRDNRTVHGADSDGQVAITILAEDRMELCYTQMALGPTKSIVATCLDIARKPGR